MLLAFLLVCGASAISQELFPRPNVYFGLRSTGSHPVLTGIAWHDASRLGDLRHSCEHHHRLQNWGWKVHNGRDFGLETIGDAACGVNITVEYAKRTECGAWTAVVSGVPSSANVSNRTLVSLIAYVATPGNGAQLNPPVQQPGLPTLLTGNSGSPGDAGRFAFLVERLAGAAMLPDQMRVRTHVLVNGSAAASAAALRAPHTLGVRLPPEDSWRIEPVLAEQATLSDRTVRLAAYHAQMRREQEEAAAVGTAGVAGAPGAPRPPQPPLRRPGEAELLKARWPVVPLLTDSWEGGAGANVGFVQHVLGPSFAVQISFIPGEGCAPEPFSSGSSGSAAVGKATRAAGSAPESPKDWLAARDALGLSPSTAPALFAERREALSSRLCATMGLRCVPATGKRQALASDIASTAEHALANLIGSVTFFFGRQLVPASGGGLGVEGAGVESEPHGLITGVPSRSFFPRGFLWDEGFHLLVLSQFDAELAARGASSWLATMDDHGWIAREQILGSEARSRVPTQFQLQRPDIANPPTILLPVLVLAVDALCSATSSAETVNISAAAATGSASRGMIDSEVLPDGSLSHGPGPTVASAGSGLAAATAAQSTTAAGAPWDEKRRQAFCSRRALVATPDKDGSSASATGGSNSYSQEPCRYACRPLAHSSFVPPLSAATTAIYSSIAAAFPRLLLHYDWFLRSQAGHAAASFRWRGATQDHCFASGLDDFPRGVTPTDVDEHVDLLAWMALASRVLGDLGGLVGAPQAELDRLAADVVRFEQRLLRVHWDAERGVFCDIGAVRQRPPAAGAPLGGQRGAPPPPASFDIGRVCHVGYVSIMPLLLRLLRPDAPQLGALLGAVADEQTLMSRHGLRSLSRQDPLFGTKEDYWRGAVWVNMNWLAVGALRYYGSVPGPHQRKAAALGAQLSSAIVDTVTREYTRTGFVWENYDSGSGRGRGTHPFTGWSALVALLAVDRFPL